MAIRLVGIRIWRTLEDWPPFLFQCEPKLLDIGRRPTAGRIIGVRGPFDGGHGVSFYFVGAALGHIQRQFVALPVHMRLSGGDLLVQVEVAVDLLVGDHDRR